MEIEFDYYYGEIPVIVNCIAVRGEKETGSVLYIEDLAVLHPDSRESLTDLPDYFIEDCESEAAERYSVICAERGEE